MIAYCESATVPLSWLTTGTNCTVTWTLYDVRTEPFLDPLPAIPKNWRWWHALARWIAPEPRVESRPSAPPTRALMGFPVSERRRRKRRFFIQRLAAL